MQTFDTPRLLLRPVRATDLADLFRIYGDPETQRFNPSGPYPSREHAREVLHRWLSHWQTEGFGHWAISLKSEADRLVGFGGLALRDFAGQRIVNLGYRLETGVWGQGIATEFANASLDAGFSHGMARIWATVRDNHLASQKVLLKAGMVMIAQVHDIPGAAPSLLFQKTRQAWLNSAGQAGARFRNQAASGPADG
ncbi:GNAT family N-acetyltransferase [Martelella alba]|uniref:GNAT family N-acetyltransferase n=1 Tax=Martelella alba TaxID=2590451 RepID=A0ABY2SFN5_9HYPH|nr:GNAT family N-acetyltransferase [Martelella alba]TKI03504.1 GNAT family N-acetyltransferase [Martelella alba]